MCAAVLENVIIMKSTVKMKRLVYNNFEVDTGTLSTIKNVKIKKEYVGTHCYMAGIGNSCHTTVGIKGIIKHC